MTIPFELHCYKIGRRPNLSAVAGFFQFPLTPGAKRIVLKPEQIQQVLQVYSAHKFVWVFNYGCIVLSNFNPPETYRFMRYLDTTCGGIDYDLLSAYNESYEFSAKTSDDPGDILEMLSLYASILAKSTELKHLESMVSRTFDQSEQFINELQNGFFRSDHTLLKKTTIHMVRHQLQMIHGFRILDRPDECRSKLKLRQTYDIAIQTYALTKRFENIQNKFTDFNGITAPYLALSHAEKEHRLLMMEIILLMIFPLPHLFKVIVPKMLTFLRLMW